MTLGASYDGVAERGEGLPLRRPPVDRRRQARRAMDRVHVPDDASALDPSRPTLAPWPRVSVVIPTLNEALNIPHVLEALPHGVHEVIIVDGASTDDTIGAARAVLPDCLVVRQLGRGKGDALAAGFSAASGDVIVTLDADGSANPSEIVLFVAALLAGADFVKGSRCAVGGGSADLTVVRRMGNRFLGAVVNLLYRTSYTDLCYGYNAFWRRCLPALAVDCDGFEIETLMNIRAAKARLRVAEVPSYERERLNGLSNLHAVRDGLRVLGVILRERKARPHHRIHHSDAPPLVVADLGAEDGKR